MNFNSLKFLIFLPFVVLVYWLLPQKSRWVWLLATSYYFYMSWNPWLIFLIMGITAVSYGLGLILEKTEKPVIKKITLITAIAMCLSVLIFFKYFNFLMELVYSIIRLFTPTIMSPSLNIILPIGISFYTFQTLSYVIDVYKGTIKAEKNFGYYALFVSYFPQLVAGPIERPGNLIPQLRAEKKINLEDMSAGFRIMLCGFFRKCVIADTCAVFVNAVFANLASANSLAIFFAGFLFLVQIYSDFAGYSEIAMGCARMMGIKLTKNFDKPLYSTSIREVFRRWHITLDQWFTDYLYFPLGGNRKGHARQLLNTVIVFAICGLWHGANWTYILWGLYAAFFLCLENLLDKPIKKLMGGLRLSDKSWGVIGFRRILMFVLFVPASIIFRSPTVADIGVAFNGMISSLGFGSAYLNSALVSLSMGYIDLLQVILCLISLYFINYVAEYKDKEGRLDLDALQNKVLARSLYAQRISAYWFGVIAIALGWLTLIANSGLSIFAYFQF